MSATQKHRLIGIKTGAGENTLLVRRFSLTEELGRLFEMDVEMFSENTGIKFDDIVGTPASVRLDLANGKKRFFHGYVNRFFQTEHHRRYARYRATVVPWLWMLTRTADCRIFQKKKVPDIIEEVFRAQGFCDYKLSLTNTYRVWEYCVQYRETDFNFVSRLMEQEGIYYFFVHEQDKDTLVLADSASAHMPYPDHDSLVYRPRTHAGAETRETVTDWVMGMEVEPGMYVLGDFNFKSPNAPIVANANIKRQHAAAEYEMFDYPGGFENPNEGDQCAKLRIEELHAQHEVLRAQTNVRGICTGCTFKLKGHPRADQDREYLITAARYQARAADYESTETLDEEEWYSCTFTSIPFAEPFRSRRLTPKPLIQGPQTAIVVGNKGEEIEADEYGRVKVQFHWDRYGIYNENSSCWIRVSQAWAGKGWGAITLPRVGQEVIVEFLEGDPDRPIITGRVYNAMAKVPYDLPAHKTMSTLKSLSSKGGGGFNEIRFEDKKGSEQVFIHAEKNLDIRVKSDTYETVGTNRHLVVKRDLHEHVENNRHEKVDADHVEEIGKDLHTKVSGKEAKEIAGSKSLTVSGDVIEMFKADHFEQTANNLYIKAMGVVIEAMQGLTVKTGGNCIVIDASGVTIQGAMVTIDSSLVKIASGPGSPAANGNALSAVAPMAVVQAAEADKAKPGEILKPPAPTTKPHNPAKAKQKKEKKSWIEIEMVDEDGKPIPSEAYRIELPDGSVAEGSLDGKGFARVDGIEPGTCQITFPNLDQEAWEKM